MKRQLGLGILDRVNLRGKNKYHIKRTILAGLEDDVMFEWAKANSGDFVITILIICITIANVVKYITGYGTYKKTNSESEPCPHGYTDWDDCPDCRH